MNNDPENQLLRDLEIVEFLKTAILEKAERYDFLSKVRGGCSEGRINQILSCHVTEADIRLIIDRFEADAEMKRIEIDLANMCFTFNSAKRDHVEKTDWDRAYEHAITYAKIEDVVRLLTGVDNFSRNIQCPLHDDGKASLRVYVKNNRFVCFGCGVRGSPVDFVMKYKNCPFREAVLFLSNL